ncbi:MAG: hypothetical protein Q9214_000374 [Letrouitia sp. 1 TL-2023]
MNARDLKAATLTEALLGIRQVKFDATELHWLQKIRYLLRRASKIRNIELSKQWKAYLAEALLVLCWIGGPTIFAAITLSAVSLLEGNLPPSVAFTALAVFQRLESTLSLVPGLLTDFVNAWVSFGRIEEFLKSPERLDATVDADSISFQNAAVAWPSDKNDLESFVLQDLSFTIPKHKLSIIAGPTGSGKSLLLQAIIGEADIIDGIILRPKKDAASNSKGLMTFGKDWIIPKTTAFVAQTAWIENESLRANILFGLPLSESRYASALQACALVQDVGTMENGDLTEIGARGINLSGGQRLRLSLARALYSRAETLVVDDVFSAVDAHVGRHILENALTGELIKDRTCIVATHHVQLCLPKADFLVVLRNRTLEYAGFPHEQRGASNSRRGSFLDGSRISGEDHKTPSEPGINRLEEPPLTKPRPTQAKMDQVSGYFDAGQDFSIEKEQRQKGRVNFAVYKQYLLSVGSWPFLYWFLVVILLFGFEVALLGRSWWVKIWTDNFKITSDITMSQIHPWAYSRFTIQNYITPSMVIDNVYQENFRYVVGFLGISLLVSVLVVVRVIWVSVGSIRASRRQFDTMTSAVLHAPLRWLDTVPVGRILNRFIADFSVIDSKLATDLASLIHYGLRVGGITVAGAFVSPWLILCVIPLIATCVAYARMYLAGARDVKRLESVKRSPIYEQFEIILLGISTIRAWNVSQTYLDHIFEKIDNHARCTWHMWLFNRWLGIRFAMVGAIFTLAVAAFAVYSPNVSASLAGLALAFSLDFSQNVFWVLRRYADVEMDMNSLERVAEFCNLPAEPTEGEIPPAHWPARGRVDFENLVVGYASDLPPVLCGVSFSCAACTRVGIVGRTGAGKSSLTLAMFRFLDARSGAIRIDGLDISLLSLNELRKRMAIIPQHPVLWLGSIRSNLNPLNEYDEAQLEEVLERVRLSARELSFESVSSSAPSSSLSLPSNNTISNPSNLFSLNTPIAEGGLNISLGQRQLLCLARALLARPKILIMDEATSAVDMETDALIQRSIRTELQDCTLLVIAHRLSTVMDFDQIVVLEEGKVVEMGEPKELMEKGTWFRQMAERSGEQGVVERT